MSIQSSFSCGRLSFSTACIISGSQMSGAFLGLALCLRRYFLLKSFSCLPCRSIGSGLACSLFLGSLARSLPSRSLASGIFRGSLASGLFRGSLGSGLKSSLARSLTGRPTGSGLELHPFYRMTRRLLCGGGGGLTRFFLSNGFTLSPCRRFASCLLQSFQASRLGDSLALSLIRGLVRGVFSSSLAGGSLSSTVRSILAMGLGGGLARRILDPLALGPCRRASRAAAHSAAARGSASLVTRSTFFSLPPDPHRTLIFFPVKGSFCRIHG